MASPISSLSKNKKTPLFFPEMSSPSPLPSEDVKAPRLELNSGYSYKTFSSSNINSLPDIKSSSEYSIYKISVNL